LDVIAKACRLSRFPGFTTGLNSILGPEDASAIILVWEPFCAAVDVLVASDNWYNRKDLEDTSPGDDGEDIALL
jgi:hypothetical protein